MLRGTVLMLNVHDEPSLQKESTLIIYANTTPDGDETSPQKKASLVKLNGTPERNEPSHLLPQPLSSPLLLPLAKVMIFRMKGVIHQLELTAPRPTQALSWLQAAVS